MTAFWSGFIIFIVVINVVGITVLLVLTRKSGTHKSTNNKMNHSYDGIEEYNNPLPRWWLFMFYITIVFSIIYLVVYPGLGSYEGEMGWTQYKQWQDETEAAKKKYQPLFDKYAAISIEKLQAEKQALNMGQRIFANTCFACHGIDGAGLPGYPNLTDDDWLYGGKPEQIKFSITQGRKGMMPALGGVLPDESIDRVVHYVLSLSGRKHDKDMALEGKKVFNMQCFACHGMDAKGNQAMGAPNLTDNIWLFGNRYDVIKDTIVNGRMGNMPAHDHILTEEQIHLVSAYVYSLSRK